MSVYRVHPQPHPSGLVQKTQPSQSSYLELWEVRGEGEGMRGEMRKMRKSVK